MKAETRILLLLLLIASSLLGVSYADVEPSSDSNEPQVLNALRYGVITHNGNTDKWCNISLYGSRYAYEDNPYLAIANIVNGTECPSNANIYVNGKKFCIRESVTSLEVFPLSSTYSVNISIPHKTAPFVLHYYNAILLCTAHPETADQITADGDDEPPRLYISRGYVHFPKNFTTCSLDLTNKEIGKVNVELVWPTLQTSINISNFFTWSLNSQLPSQDYTAISTDVKHFQLKFTQWRQNSTDKIFIRVSTPCPAPESVGNGTVYSPKSIQQYILGDELYYICDKGFSKASEVMVCQPNGSWSPTPLCTVHVTCPQHESLLHGTICSPNSVAQHLPGDELCYSCHDRFKKPPEKTSCQNNGSWSPSPSCTALEESEKREIQQQSCILPNAISLTLLLALICVCVAVGWCFKVEISEWVRTKWKKCRSALSRQSDDTSSTGVEQHVGNIELQYVLVNGQQQDQLGNDTTRNGTGHKKNQCLDDGNRSSSSSSDGSTSSRQRKGSKKQKSRTLKQTQHMDISKTHPLRKIAERFHGPP